VDHRDISNTVITSAFRVAGAEASDLAPCSFFSMRLLREKGTEKIGYKNFQPFCFYVGHMPLLSFFVTGREKPCAFIH